MVMEKRQDQAKNKNESGTGRKKTASSGSAANDLIRKLVPLFEETVKAEFAPIQYSIRDLYKRMSKIEKKMLAIEKWITEAMAAEDNYNDKWHEDPEKLGKDHRVVFQEIRVDTVFVDKYEQLNTIGSLGVKELSGQMNIGATIENSSNPSEELSEDSMEKWKEKMKKFKEMKEKYGIDQNMNRVLDENPPQEKASVPTSDLKQNDKK